MRLHEAGAAREEGKQQASSDAVWIEPYDPAIALTPQELQERQAQRGKLAMMKSQRAQAIARESEALAAEKRAYARALGRAASSNAIDMLRQERSAASERARQERWEQGERSSASQSHVPTGGGDATGEGGAGVGLGDDEAATSAPPHAVDISGWLEGNHETRRRDEEEEPDVYVRAARRTAGPPPSPRAAGGGPMLGGGHGALSARSQSHSQSRSHAGGASAAPSLIDSLYRGEPVRAFSVSAVDGATRAAERGRAAASARARAAKEELLRVEQARERKNHARILGSAASSLAIDQLRKQARASSPDGFRLSSSSRCASPDASRRSALAVDDDDSTILGASPDGKLIREGRPPPSMSGEERYEAFMTESSKRGFGSSASTQRGASPAREGGGGGSPPRRAASPARPLSPRLLRTTEATRRNLAEARRMRDESARRREDSRASVPFRGAGYVGRASVCAATPSSSHGPGALAAMHSALTDGLTPAEVYVRVAAQLPNPRHRPHYHPDDPTVSTASAGGGGRAASGAGVRSVASSHPSDVYFSTPVEAPRMRPTDAARLLQAASRGLLVRSRTRYFKAASAVQSASRGFIARRHAAVQLKHARSHNRLAAMSRGMSPNNSSARSSAPQGSMAVPGSPAPPRGKWAAAGGPVLALPAQRPKHAAPHASPRNRPAHDVQREAMEKRKEEASTRQREAFVGVPSSSKPQFDQVRSRVDTRWNHPPSRGPTADEDEELLRASGVPLPGSNQPAEDEEGDVDVSDR